MTHDELMSQVEDEVALFKTERESFSKEEAEHYADNCVEFNAQQKLVFLKLLGF